MIYSYQKYPKEEELFFSATRKRVGKAVEKYKLIVPGDKVLVGVSGGKDSLFLLEALAMLKRVIPFDFDIAAFYVKVTGVPYSIDYEFLSSMCKHYNIILYSEELELGDIETSSKSPCFICSWKRRKVLFEKMKKLGCNKLALGHHMDDAIETLLLNMLFHANISSMPPLIEMFKGAFSIIRPLLLVEECFIKRYVSQREIPDEFETCPFEDQGNRLEVKKIISTMSELNPSARVNLFRSMSKIDHEYLP